MRAPHEKRKIIIKLIYIGGTLLTHQMNYFSLFSEADVFDPMECQGMNIKVRSSSFSLYYNQHDTLKTFLIFHTTIILNLQERKTKLENDTAQELLNHILQGIFQNDPKYFLGSNILSHLNHRRPKILLESLLLIINFLAMNTCQRQSNNTENSINSIEF